MGKLSGTVAATSAATLAGDVLRKQLLGRAVLIAAVLASGSLTLAALGTPGEVQDPNSSAGAASAAPTTLGRVSPVGRTTPPGALSQTLRVEARDLITDAPVKGVLFKLSVAGGMKSEASSDADGIARFEYTFPEAAGPHTFSITARRDGLVPLAARWIQESSSSTPPDRLLFQTEKGTTLSGRVLDQDGQPLAGAVVVASVKKGYPRSQQWVDVSYESTKTDAKGHWTFTGVPDQPDSVEIAAYDYLHLSEHASFQPEPFKSLSALRDGSAILRLQRGTLVEGTVCVARWPGRRRRRGFLRGGARIRECDSPSEVGCQR